MKISNRNSIKGKNPTIIKGATGSNSTMLVPSLDDTSSHTEVTSTSSNDDDDDDDDDDQSSCRSRRSRRALVGVLDDKTNAKRVSFGTVRVHTHPLCLGDNPSCSQGLPLQLDWDCVEMTEYSLAMRGHDRIARRRWSMPHRRAFVVQFQVSLSQDQAFPTWTCSQHTATNHRTTGSILSSTVRLNQLSPAGAKRHYRIVTRIPHEERRKLLLAQGYTEQALQQAADEVKAVQQSRLRSQLEHVQEKLESMQKQRDQPAQSVQSTEKAANKTTLQHEGIATTGSTATGSVKLSLASLSDPALAQSSNSKEQLDEYRKMAGCTLREDQRRQRLEQNRQKQQQQQSNRRKLLSYFRRSLSDRKLSSSSSSNLL